MTRANIFDQPEPDDVNIQYTELSNMLDFTEFHPDNYLFDEKHVLQPQLEKMGYTVLFWSDVPHNYLAHAQGRVCKCVYKHDGGIRWFIYG